jgi:uncharacterized protein YbdZ (MbtH family)
MKQVAQKQAFYQHVAAQRNAIWPVADGVSFVSRRENQDWGIALHVENPVMSPEQLRDALERRFVEPDRYSHYFLFLNVQQDFVVWRASSEIGATLEDICHEQLQLAGLEHLNA